MRSFFLRATSKSVFSRLAGTIIALSLSAVFVTAFSENKQEGAAPKPAGLRHPNGTAVLETDAGTIKFELLDDEAPKTAENFRLLAESGYYNGTIFHRVANGFMIQGGDPNGNGTGGRTATGAMLPNEISRGSPLYQGGYRRGPGCLGTQKKPENTDGGNLPIRHAH